MVPRSIIALAALALGACAAQPCEPQEPTVNTVRVEVPVPVARDTPPELVACSSMPTGWKPPVFVKPDKCVSGDAKACVQGDPAASSALTPAGEAALRQWIETGSACLASWVKWASTPVGPPPAAAADAP